MAGQAMDVLSAFGCVCLALIARSGALELARVHARGNEHLPNLKLHVDVVIVPLEILAIGWLLKCQLAQLWLLQASALALQSALVIVICVTQLCGNTYGLWFSRKWVTGILARCVLTWVAWDLETLGDFSPFWSNSMYLLFVLGLVFTVVIGEGDSSSQFDLVSSKHIDFMGIFGDAQKLEPRNGKLPRVAILSLGSRGDVQPFIALAQELQDSGRASCVIATMDSYKSLVERYGIDCVTCGINDMGWSEHNKANAQHIADVILEAQSVVANSFTSVGESFFKACKDCDAIVTTSVTSGFGLSIGEKIGVPVWQVKFAPDNPTRAFSPPGETSSRFGVINLMRWYRHWARIGLAVSGAKKKSKGRNPEDVFRQDFLGIGPLGGGKRIDQVQNMPTLCAFSSSLIPKPSDYPVNLRITGFWFVKPTPNKTGPGGSASLSRLDKFLQTGPPPICINFGSMTEVARRFDLINKVIQGIALHAKSVQQSARIVIVDSCAEPGDEKHYVAQTEIATSEPVELLILTEIPHDQLFPHCSLVVHHGGAGTSARVIEFAVPAIIVPVMLWTDQPLWADRIEALGAAVNVTRSSKAFVTDIATAVKKIIMPGSLYKARAEAMAGRLKAEGERCVEKAAEEIMRHFTTTTGK